MCGVSAKVNFFFHFSCIKSKSLTHIAQDTHTHTNITRNMTHGKTGSLKQRQRDVLAASDYLKLCQESGQGIKEAMAIYKQKVDSYERKLISLDNQAKKRRMKKGGFFKF